MYPLVRVDSTKCKTVGQAGGVLLTTTVGLAGIDRLLSTALSRWRKPSAVHVACSETDGPRTLADNHGPGLTGPLVHLNT